MTCHPVGKERNQTVSTQEGEQCSAAHGPVLTTLKAIIEFLDGHGDAVTASFTIVLAISTILLWDATKRTAETAERALTDLEAPFIVVRITNNGLHRTGMGMIYGGQVSINYQFSNYGRSPAMLLECVDDLISVPIGDDLPSNRNPIAQRSAPLPYGNVAAPNGNDTPEFSYRFQPDIQGAHNLRANLVYFVRVIRYATIFNVSYTQGFCFLFDDQTGGWVTAGDENWSYCRQDKEFYSPPGARVAHP